MTLTDEQMKALPEDLLIDGDWKTKEVHINGKPLRIEKSRQVWDHSTAYNWGYGGSGPAQLALAILLEYLPKEAAVRLHQPFKFNVIGTWEQGEDFEVRLDLKEKLQRIISLMPNF